MALQKNNDNCGADFFSHDRDMRNDIKVKALRQKFSHTGYAVWCFLLEYLTDCTDFEFENTEVNQELLAADFDVPVGKLREIIAYSVKIGLLQCEDGKLFSNAHKRRFTPMLERRAKLSEAGKRGMASRWENRTTEEAGSYNPVITETDNPVITETDNHLITSDNHLITSDNIVEYSIVENSIVENSIVNIKETPKGVKKTASRFSAPTIDEVRDYAKEKGYNINAEHFVDYYTSNGWKVGRNSMKDWRATVRMWASRDRSQSQIANSGTHILGVGEYINSKGIRTYGTSGQLVPQDAPPRPSEAYYWSDNSHRWERTI